MKTRLSLRWMVGLGALALAACASTPPSSFYTLTALATEQDEAVLRGGNIAVGLGPVTFPVFLDRPQIVSRASGNRLNVDEYNRWGGTLQDDFLRVWSENLALLLGTSRLLVFPSEIRYPLDVRVAAEVLAFEGTGDGQALLKVRWVLLDGYSEQVVAVRETSYRRPWSGMRDSEALIAALSETLAAFSRDVASEVRALPRPQPPPVSAGR